jgi:5'-3' exonuclease
MILIDFNQIALSSIFAMSNELNQLDDDETDTLKLIRHVVLDTIKGYKKAYTKTYGEVIIACDSKNYWRRDIFPFYKANRAKERDQDKHNWKLIFKCLDSVRADLIEFFPYKVLLIDNVEADDIIAVLAKNSKEKVLIVSRDHDYNQLYK